MWSENLCGIHEFFLYHGIIILIFLMLWSEEAAQNRRKISSVLEVYILL